MNSRKSGRDVGPASPSETDSATRYQHLVENIQDAVVEFEFVDDEPIVRGVNDAFVDTFGYQREEVCGDSLNAWIVPEEFDGQADRLDARTESGEITSQEVTRQTATGHREFLHRSIPYDDAGPVDGIAVYTDITERKRAERKRQLLSEASRRLGGAETLREGYEATLETICSYTTWSYGEVWEPLPSGEALSFVVGHSEEASCAQFLAESREVTFPVGEGLPGRVYESESSEWIPDVSTEPPGVFHRTNIAGSSGLRAAFGTPIVADGSVVAVLVFFLEEDRGRDDRLIEDLTDVSRNLGGLVARKQAERTVRRRNEQLEQFADVVSHDLRNPLNVAMNHLEFLESESTHVTEIAAAHERMEELIGDILTLARQGQTVTDQVPISLDHCVRQSARMVDSTALTLELPTTRTVLGDESRVRQLFENLLRNSVEHGSTGSLAQPDDSVEHGSTSTRPRAHDGDELGSADVTVTVGDTETGFFVADDGPGIPTEDRDDVFDSGYTTRTEGTGLGLPLVREIAKAHGWTVTVTESETGGARFEFDDVTVAQ